MLYCVVLYPVMICSVMLYYIIYVHSMYLCVCIHISVYMCTSVHIYICIPLPSSCRSISCSVSSISCSVTAKWGIIHIYYVRVCVYEYVYMCPSRHHGAQYLFYVCMCACVCVCVCVHAVLIALNILFRAGENRHYIYIVCMYVCM